MFSKHKGEIGYLKKQPVRIGLLALLLLVLCAAIFMTGFIMHGDAKNIFTIIAVLGTLPVAKLIVSFIIGIKAEKYSFGKANAASVKELFGEKDVLYGFDFYLTSYKTNFPLSSCFVFDETVIALSADKDMDMKECKEHIEKYLANNSITGIKVYILDSLDKYSDRIKSVKDDYAKTEKDIAAFNLIKNLSL